MDNGHLLEVIEAEVKMFDQTGVTLTQMVRDGQWSLNLRWLKLRSRCLTRQELPWLRWSGIDNGHLLEVIEAEVKMFDQTWVTLTQMVRDGQWVTYLRWLKLRSRCLSNQTGVTLTQMVRDGQWSLTWGDWSWGQGVWPDRSYPDSGGQGWTMVTYLRWLKLRSRCLTRHELPWLRWSGMDNGHLLEVIEAEVKVFDQTGVTLAQMVRDGQWSLTWGDWSWGQYVWPDRSVPWLRWSGMDNGHLLEVIEAEVKMFDQTGVTLTSDGQGWTMVTYLRWLKLRSRCLTRQELPWLRWSGMDNGHLLEVIEAEVKMFDQTGVTLT